VDDAFLVRLGERRGERHREAQEALRRQAAGGDQVAQREALDPLHDQERLVLHLVDGVNGDDVGVIERRESPRLAGETPSALHVRRHRRGQHLDRHVAAQPGVTGEVDLAHGPPPDLAEDRIAVERFADDRQGIVHLTALALALAIRPVDRFQPSSAFYDEDAAHLGRDLQRERKADGDHRSDVSHIG
jgi:hypothetical protein